LYLRAGESGDFSALQGREELTEEQLVLEHMMLGLRTSAGLPEAYLRANCDACVLAQALACGNLVRQSDGTLRIPESSFFVSDSIITSLV
jgi:coproporphyrinogen III oxidase-like Fe-S oxidoreductase